MGNRCKATINTFHNYYQPELAADAETITRRAADRRNA